MKQQTLRTEYQITSIMVKHEKCQSLIDDYTSRNEHSCVDKYNINCTLWWENCVIQIDTGYCWLLAWTTDSISNLLSIFTPLRNWPHSAYYGPTRGWPCELWHSTPSNNCGDICARQIHTEFAFSRVCTTLNLLNLNTVKSVPLLINRDGGHNLHISRRLYAVKSSRANSCSLKSCCSTFQRLSLSPSSGKNN